MRLAFTFWAVLGTAVPVAAQQPVQSAPPATDTVYCFVRSDSLPLEGPCAGLKAIVDERPEIVRQGVAEYPPQLRAAGVQGEVVVRMIVDTSGRPELESVTIVQTPHPDFEPAVRAFMATLEFRPARVAGRAVRVLINLPLRFSIQPPPAADPATAPQAEEVYDCLRKCPDGVQPPRFTFFPQIQFQDSDASVRGRTSRMRTFLTFHAVVGADGVLEPETVQLAGGTARSTEAELRRGLAQARFQPGRSGGAPVRARVALRFDFEAEGTNWIKYTYRVVAR